MSSLAHFTRTGRVHLGPASDLVEMESADASRHTAIVFHPEYRRHPALNAGLSVVLPVLETPMVPGLLGLGAFDLAASTFVYPTGLAWSVGELFRTLTDLGRPGGVRAGVELLRRAGAILVEAAESGEPRGIFSHGGLTPWRIVLDGAGKVQIIGYALPQVEILALRDNPENIPREDAFRYCPPERIDGRRENFTSDLYSLALVAFEVMIGHPVYDGMVNDIRAAAATGDAARSVTAVRDRLPESVRELLLTLMRPEFRDRFSSGVGFLDLVKETNSDPDVEGPSLSQLMAWHRDVAHRPRARLTPSATAMLSSDELRRMSEAGPRAAQPRSSAPVRAPPGTALSVVAPSTETSTELAVFNSAANEAPSSPRWAAPTRSRAAPDRRSEPTAPDNVRLERRDPLPELRPVRVAAPPPSASQPPASSRAAAPVRAPASLLAASTASTARPAPPSSAASHPSVSSPSRPSASRPPPARTPDPVPLHPKGDLVAMTVLRAPGGPAHKRRLPTDATLAEIAALLVGSLVPIPTSADGRVLGGYRVGTESAPLPPETRLGDLDPAEPIAFHFVPSRLLPVELTIDGRVLLLDLATAVPVVSLVDGLCRQFGLPAGSWVLATPERDLSPFAYLADDPPRALALTKR